MFPKRPLFLVGVQFMTVTQINRSSVCVVLLIDSLRSGALVFLSSGLLEALGHTPNPLTSRRRWLRPFENTVRF